VGQALLRPTVNSASTVVAWTPREHRLAASGREAVSDEVLFDAIRQLIKWCLIAY
jgi:hypothetical protein